jgi:hypothetical protein
MNEQISTAALKKGAVTRSQNGAHTNKNEGKGSEVPKRKAEGSPAKEKTHKRSAFGDITNVSDILLNMKFTVFHKNTRIYIFIWNII